MSNELEKIAEDVGHGVKVAGEDAVKGLGKVIGILGKTEKVLQTVIAEEGTLKTVLIAEVKAGVALAKEVETVVRENGLDLAADASLLADIKAYFLGLVDNLVPVIEKVYDEIVVDVDAKDTAAAA